MSKLVGYVELNSEVVIELCTTAAANRALYKSALLDKLAQQYMEWHNKTWRVRWFKLYKPINFDQAKAYIDALEPDMFATDRWTREKERIQYRGCAWDSRTETLHKAAVLVYGTTILADAELVEFLGMWQELQQ